MASPQFSILINAFSFILSGIVLTRITLKNQQTFKVEDRTPADQLGFLASWKEGWSIIFQNRILTASILFGIISTSTIQMIDAQLVTLFSEVFPENAGVTGWAISAIGIGSLVIVVLLNRVEKIQRYGWYFGLGSFLIGSMTAGFGYLGEYTFILVAITLAIIGGIGNGLTYTAIQYLIQKEPPKEAIGRVSGIVDSTLSLLFMIGPLLGGILITQFGILSTFRGIGMALALIGVAGILLQKFIWKANRSTLSHVDSIKGTSTNSSYSS